MLYCQLYLSKNVFNSLRYQDMKLNTKIISLNIDKQYPLRGFNVKGKPLYNINKENAYE